MSLIELILLEYDTDLDTNHVFTEQDVYGTQEDMPYDCVGSSQRDDTSVPKVEVKINSKGS